MKVVLKQKPKTTNSSQGYSRGGERGKWKK